MIRSFDSPELSSYDDVKKLPESTLIAIEQAVLAGDLKTVFVSY